MSWPELNDWSDMTFWFDLISWSDLADLLIRLISSWSERLIKTISKKILTFFLKERHFLNDQINWSDQLIKKFQFFSKLFFEKKNIFWMIWSTDLISWLADKADQLINFFWKEYFFKKKIFEKKNIFWMIWSADWLIRWSAADLISW